MLRTTPALAQLAHAAPAALLTLTLSAPAAEAQTPLTSELVVHGFQKPTWVGSPDGDPRIFVCEQDTGRVRISINGGILASPFLDLGDEISSGGERGLLGLAFHPLYASNGRVFVIYTDVAGDVVLKEFAASVSNPNVVDPFSGTELLRVPQPGENHNAGALAFGPLDGYLYVGLGDGGTSDPNCTGQSQVSLLGKVLRIDVDVFSGYDVPADNPYVSGGPFPPETWSVGWRNPWRLAFDAATGEMLVADVGENSWEEISYEPPLTGGRNYGWSRHEGNSCFNPNSCSGQVAPCDDPSFVFPIHEYDHLTGCAIIGGVVYQGTAIPDLAGTYFFGDFCASRIWSLRAAGGVVTDFQERTSELVPGSGLTIQFPTAFGQDGDGELLIADFVGGEIFRVIPVPTDCDENGIEDALEVATNPLLDLNGSGVLDICEGLAADQSQVSVAIGGTVQLDLQAGEVHADRTYFVLGTASGTTPGVVVDGLPLALNVADGYFAYTLNNPNGAVLQNTLALLDGAGNGSATLAFPPLSPSDIGSTVHHAYVVFDLGSGKAVFTSPSLPLDLVP